MSKNNKFGSFTDRINGSKMIGNEDNDEEDEDEYEVGDEDSMTELGQIALLSSSKASLRYRSMNDINLSRKGSINSKRSKDLKSSRLLLGKQYIENETEKTPIEDEVYVEEGSVSLLDRLWNGLFPFKGYLFGIMSAFSFSLAQVVMKRAKWFSGSDHSLIRYLVTFIVMFTVLKYKNLNIMGPRKYLRILLFRGFVGACALITLYFAIMLINPSDAITITHTSIIITAVLARIFLNEKITLAHFISLILTIIGVLFICKPSFLFDKTNSNHVATSNITNCSIIMQAASTKTTTLLNKLVPETIQINKTVDVNNNIDCTNKIVEENGIVKLKTIIGICLTFISSFAGSFVYLVLKKLSNSKVHWASNTIYVCWFGTPFSLILSLILIQKGLAHTNFELEKKDFPMDLFYSCMASCLSIIGQIFLNLSLRFEDATKIAIVRTIDVFFSFMLQYLLLNIPVDIFSFTGAISIILGTCAVLLFKLLENKYEKFKKKELNKNMKDFSINKMKRTDEKDVMKKSKQQNVDQPQQQQQNSEPTQHNKGSSAKKSILKLIFFKF